MWGMLEKKQLDELKELLEQSQNPLFFYDNDADGLCSYLLLVRYLGRGKGVAIRSYPELDASYSRKVRELGADVVFVLDKPAISEKFIEEVIEMKVPIIIVDHHLSTGVFPEEVKVFNATKSGQGEPVSYECFRIVSKKEDVWIALIGCISDHYLPDFVDEFVKQYPEMWGKDIKKPFDALYKTEIGEIAQSFNLGLKDSTSHVLQLQDFLIQCKNPHEVFVENTKNHNFLRKYKILKKKLVELISKAEKHRKQNILFFKYGGETSMSADVSNALFYKFPDSYIIIAYVKGEVSNLSIRGKNVLKILEKVLKEFPDASGGGHLDAVGAKIKTQDLDKFKEMFEKEIKR